MKKFYTVFDPYSVHDFIQICLKFIYLILKKRHIQRELFDGYLIMYFSQKNILFFLIYFFVKPSFWKSKNTNRLHFWRGLRIYISFWLNRKKRSRYGQKKANSYKAHRFVHAHLHVFHWTVGLYYQKYLKDYI